MLTQRAVRLSASLNERRVVINVRWFILLCCALRDCSRFIFPAECIVCPNSKRAALLCGAIAFTPRAPKKRRTTGMMTSVMMYVLPDPPGPRKNTDRTGISRERSASVSGEFRSLAQPLAMAASHKH